MDEENIQIKVRYRYITPGVIEAEIVVVIAWVDGGDVQYEGRESPRKEEALVTTGIFPYEGELWSYAGDQAKRKARAWAAERVARGVAAL